MIWVFEPRYTEKYDKSASENIDLKMPGLVIKSQNQSQIFHIEIIWATDGETVDVRLAADKK